MNLFEVSNVFFKRAGYRIYVISILIFAAGILETVGVAMLAPLLSLSMDSEAGRLARFIFATFETVGLQINLSNILGVTVAVFLIKAIFIFLLLALSNFTQIQIRKSLQNDLTQSFSRATVLTTLEDTSGTITNLTVREVPRFLQSFMEFTRIPISIFHVLSYLGLAVLVDTKTSILLMVIGVSLIWFLRPILKSHARFPSKLVVRQGVYKSQ